MSCIVMHDPLIAPLLITCIFYLSHHKSTTSVSFIPHICIIQGLESTNGKIKLDVTLFKLMTTYDLLNGLSEWLHEKSCDRDPSDTNFKCFHDEAPLTSTIGKQAYDLILQHKSCSNSYFRKFTFFNSSNGTVHDCMLHCYICLTYTYTTQASTIQPVCLSDYMNYCVSKTRRRMRMLLLHCSKV